MKVSQLLFIAACCIVVTPYYTFADCQNVIIQPAAEESGNDGKIDDMESRIKSLENSSDERSGVAAIHQLKNQQAEERADAEEEREDHIKDVKQNAKHESEGAEQDEISAADRSTTADAIHHNEASVEQQQHEAEVEEIDDIRNSEAQQKLHKKHDIEAEEAEEAAATKSAIKTEHAGEDDADKEAAESAAKAEAEIDHAKATVEENAAKTPAKSENLTGAAPAIKKDTKEAIPLAYSAGPCPCIKEMPDRGKGCDGASNKDACPEAQRELREAKEETDVLEHKLDTKESTQDEEQNNSESGEVVHDEAKGTPYNTEGESSDVSPDRERIEKSEGKSDDVADEEDENDYHDEGMFLQRMSKMMKQHGRRLHSLQQYLEPTMNHLRYSLGFL